MMVSSASPSTTSTLGASASPSPARHSTMCFVFAAGRLSASTTRSLPATWRAASAARRAAWHGTTDEQEVLVRPHGDDLEVPGRHPLRSVAAGHALALEDATREGAVADRAPVPEVLVRPVRAREARELVPLHDACGAPALGDAGDMHHLARLEHVTDADLGADRGRLFAREPELAQHREGAGTRLLELALHGLRQPPRLGTAEAELGGRVAVALGLASGDHRARARLDDGDRHEDALGGIHLRHAELPSDETWERHGYCSLISTSTPAARSSLPSASMVCCVGSRMSSSRL